MDPTAWLEFIKRAIQSPEALAFLVFGGASGGMVGFLVGRWFALHNASLFQLRESLKQRELELERLRLQLIEVKNGGPRPPIPPPPGGGTGPQGGPVANAWWAKVESHLAGLGIGGQEITRLKDALAAKNKGIIDTDNRLRIMVWRGGNGLVPVAMIWRSEGRPRVLFPDGTEQNVEKKDLEEIAQSL